MKNMVSITRSIALISSLIMLFSGIAGAEFKTYNSGGSNLFVGGILQTSSNGDSAEQKWKDFASQNNAVFVPTYYSIQPDGYADDIDAVNAAARSTATDLNGLTRDELGAKGLRTYDTVIGYSGGTTTVITAMASGNVNADTLILISPMMGNNANSKEMFEQKIRDIIKLNPNIQILVFQSEQDIMPGQYKFLDNDYLLNMFPNNIKVYPIKLENCGVIPLCHNYFFDTWAKENIKNGAYIGSVVPKVPIRQALGLGTPLLPSPTSGASPTSSNKGPYVPPTTTVTKVSYSANVPGNWNMYIGSWSGSYFSYKATFAQDGKIYRDGSQIGEWVMWTENGVYKIWGNLGSPFGGTIDETGMSGWVGYEMVRKWHAEKIGGSPIQKTVTTYNVPSNVAGVGPLGGGGGVW